MDVYSSFVAYFVTISLLVLIGICFIMIEKASAEIAALDREITKLKNKVGDFKKE